MNKQNDELLGTNCQRFQELLERRWADDCNHSQVDTALLDRHRRECSECALFAEALESFGGDFVDTRNDVTDRNEIRSLVDTAFTQRSKKRTFKFTAAAAAAVIMIGAFAFYSSFNSKTIINDDGRFELLAGSLKIDNHEITSGDRFNQIQKNVTPIRDNALVAADGALFVAIGNGSSMQVLRSMPKEIKLGLSSGRIAVHLTPGTDIALNIEVPDGNVLVTGTVFIVEVVDGETSVEVVRGKVLVSSNKTSKTLPVKLAAGHSLSISDQDHQPRVAILDDPLLALLGISETATQQLADNQSERQDEDVPSETRDETAVVASTTSTNSRPNTNHTMAHSAALDDSITKSPESLLRRARSCRAEMDWDCATKSYKQLIKSYPKLPDATTALIPLGQILLERTNNPKAALKYFKKYLKLRPNGGLAPEAQWGRCNSYRALSNSNNERQCLEGFLDNYPGNLNARIANFRLEEL